MRGVERSRGRKKHTTFGRSISRRPQPERERHQERRQNDCSAVVGIIGHGCRTTREQIHEQTREQIPPRPLEPLCPERERHQERRQHATHKAAQPTYPISLCRQAEPDHAQRPERGDTIAESERFKSEDAGICGRGPTRAPQEWLRQAAPRAAGGAQRAGAGEVRRSPTRDTRSTQTRTTLYLVFSAKGSVSPPAPVRACCWGFYGRYGCCPRPVDLRSRENFRHYKFKKRGVSG